MNVLSFHDDIWFTKEHVRAATFPRHTALSSCKNSFKDEDYLFIFIYLLLLLTASGYVPGGSDTTVHNTPLYNTQNNTYTLKTIRNTKITNTIT
jgi:hypothetical protein